MEDYTIEVNRIEELQMIRDLQELEQIFTRARRTIIGGNDVILVRKNNAGKQERFQVISNESEFEDYRQRVFRYL